MSEMGTEESKYTMSLSKRMVEQGLGEIKKIILLKSDKEHKDWEDHNRLRPKGKRHVKDGENYTQIYIYFSL